VSNIHKVVRDELSVLSAFLTVAEERSFTRRRNVLGCLLRAQPRDAGAGRAFGVRLLARTTRSVAPPTPEAAHSQRLAPGARRHRGAVDLITGLRDRPADASFSRVAHCRDDGARAKLGHNLRATTRRSSST